MKTFQLSISPTLSLFEWTQKMYATFIEINFYTPGVDPHRPIFPGRGDLCSCGGWGVYATTPKLYIHVFLDSNGFIMNVKLGILWTVVEMIVDWLIDWLIVWCSTPYRQYNIFQSYNDVNYYHIVTMLFWSFPGFTTLVVFHEHSCYFEDLLLYTSKKTT